MGIRLDWEIEAEQNTYVAGEDPAAARRRRGLRLRLILMVFVVLGIIGVAVALLALRAQQIQRQEENLLRATIDAEVASLRIGSEQEFLAIQRSADTRWIDYQSQVFDRYEQLKVENNIQLTGQIRDIEIDDRRARVQVEEIIDGVPFTQIWFYWLYSPVFDENGEETIPGGWYHVPPDYDFWGVSQLIETEHVRISYREVDEQLAESMASQIDLWLTTACAALSCDPVPQIAVSIEVDQALTLRWSEQNPWQLRLPSPYIDRARSDMPFSPELRAETASLIAERLVDGVTESLTVQFASDAAFLRQSAIVWLVGQFVQVNSETFLYSSLINAYETSIIGEILRNLQPDSSIAVLSAVTGTPSLNDVQADWRDFLSWRLNLENQLIRAGDLDNFLRLYDTREELTNTLAFDRYNQLTTPESPIVLLVQSSPVPTGELPQLVATVQVGAPGATTQQEIIFRLVDNVWRRVN